VGWCSWTTLPAAVQPPSEPGGDHLAAGEGVFDAPAALRERRGAEEGGGRGHGEAQGKDGAGGVAKSMRGYLSTPPRLSPRWGPQKSPPTAPAWASHVAKPKCGRLAG